MSSCCFYQVVIFQAVLITLVRCAFLRNHTACFCTVILGVFAYCDSAILRSVRNLEQNATGLGKAAADTFCELCIFQFGKSTCYAGNAASQIFCKTGKWIEYINATLCINPVVLLGKRCPVQQQSVEQLCGVAQVCIQQKAGIGQILRQWHIGFQVIRNGIHLHFYIRISARPFESFGFYHCSDDLLPSEDTDWHGR